MKKNTDEEEVRLEMLMVRSQISYHKFRYFGMDDAVISDGEFDTLEKKYAEICDVVERMYPAMYDIYRPAPWAGLHRTPHGYPKKELNYHEKKEI